jgi:hypothetical protein
MAKYLARTSPTCRGYLGIVIAEPDNENVKPISAYFTTCGYEMAWALIWS